MWQHVRRPLHRRWSVADEPKSHFVLNFPLNVRPQWCNREACRTRRSPARPDFIEIFKCSRVLALTTAAVHSFTATSLVSFSHLQHQQMLPQQCMYTDESTLLCVSCSPVTLHQPVLCGTPKWPIFNKLLKQVMIISGISAFYLFFPFEVHFISYFLIN